MKTAEQDQEEEAATATLETTVAAKEISADPATELVGVVTLKEEQRVALKAFQDRKRVFVLLPTGFGKSRVKCRGVYSRLPRGGDAHLVSPLAPIDSYGYLAQLAEKTRIGL